MWVYNYSLQAVLAGSTCLQLHCLGRDPSAADRYQDILWGWERERESDQLLQLLHSRAGETSGQQGYSRVGETRETSGQLLQLQGYSRVART